MEVQSSKGRKRNGTVSAVVAVTGFAIAAALFWFNRIASGYEYYMVGNAVLLFFVPMLVILCLGEDAADFGLGLGQSKKVKWLTLILFAGLLPVLIVASRQPGFKAYYPIFRQFSSFMGSGPYVDGAKFALLYGWLSYGMYMFFWEFFFRGYLLFGLGRSIKWWAIIVQTIPFFLLHINKPPLELAASIPAGIILGILAMRGKSFVPCFALHWAASVTFDVLVMMARR